MGDGEGGLRAKHHFYTIASLKRRTLFAHTLGLYCAEKFAAIVKDLMQWYDTK